MPFLATRNNIRINSLEITDEQFESLRGVELLCAGCKSPMHIRYSKAPNRIRHFVHTAKTNHCYVTNMSQEHLGLQALVEMSINKTAGWRAELEYQGEGWRGDVVAINDDTSERISFEVQLSPMTEAKALERTQKHLDSGINRVVWLCGKEFDWLTEVPSVHFTCERGWNPQNDIEVTYQALPPIDNSYYWSFQEKSLQLSQFIQSALQKQLLARYGGLCCVIETGTRRTLRFMSGMDRWHFQTLEEVRSDTVNNAFRLAEESVRLQRYLPI